LGSNRLGRIVGFYPVLNKPKSLNFRYTKRSSSLYNFAKMGASQSVADVMTQTINSTFVDVLNKSSTNVSGNIRQSNVIDASGATGSVISGNIQDNTASINMEAVAQSAASGNLQSELTSAIQNKLSQEQDALGISQQMTDVNTIVENEVKAQITNEAISDLKTEIDQTNEILLKQSIGVQLVNNIQKNKAEAIMKLANSLSSAIVEQVKTSATVENDVTQKTTNPLSDFISGLTGSMRMMMVVVLVGFIGFLAFGGKIMGASTGMAKAALNPAVLAIAGGVLLVIVLMVFVMDKKGSSSDSPSDSPS
jgi:hypothetical protein